MNKDQLKEHDKVINKDRIIYLINEEEKTAFLIKNESPIKDIYIPRSVIYELQEYVIISIRKNAFRGCVTLKSIQFAPDSQIKTIESDAFNYSSIESIEIPSSIEELEEGWCDGVIFLNQIKISPDNPYFKLYEGQFIIGKSSPEKENFDSLVFSIRKIEIAIIPDFIEIIGSYAFSNSKLSDIKISSNSKLRIIEKYAFSHCPIEKFVIPPHLTYIGTFSFSFCVKLQEFECPKNSELQTIEGYAFGECPIKKISIPSSLIELKDGWSYGMKKLNKIEIMPNNPFFSFLDEKYIVRKSSPETNNYDILVFAVKNIVEAKIPNFIEIIGSYAFLDCDNLRTIEFSSDSKLRIIDSCAFAGTLIEKISIPPNVEVIGNFAFYRCYNLLIIDIPINSKLKIIKNRSFANTLIKSIFIPSEVIELDEGWCNEIPNITEINVIENNPYFKSWDNKYIIKKSSPEKENFDILEFAVRSIEKVIIPDFIETINPFAFSECSHIKDIAISKYSKLNKIENHAFYHSSITNIIFPPSLTEIGQSAFYLCNKLKKVEFPDNSKLKIISERSFHKAIFEIFYVPIHVTQIHEQAFFGCRNLSKLVIPSDSELVEIGKQAFSYTQIHSIFIPKNVSKFDSKAFFYCYNMKIVELDENSNLKKIDLNMFQHSKNIIIMIHN